MDFVWVTDAAGDITGVTVSSPLTGGGTSGTVTVGILSGTTSNLGAVQLSDSTSSTSTTLAATANAVKNTYDLAAAPAAGKNVLLNSNFSIWQRGTSINSSGAYTADRWQQYSNSAQTVSRQVTGDTTNLAFIQYCARVQRTAGNATTTALALDQSMETINSIPLAGKTVTISFYARRGANYSSASNVLNFEVITGTGTDQTILGGYTSQAATNVSSTLTTTWQRFTNTLTIPAATTEVGVRSYYIPSGTAGANDYYEITGVQLEIAGSASAYSPNTSTYQAELAACQRYYYRTTGTGSDQTVFTTFGYTYTTTNSVVNLPLAVTMRVKPTAIDYANLSHIQTNGGQSTLSALTINNGGTNVVQLIGVSGAITNTLSTAVSGNAGGTPFIGLSAEL
jgi:hypothetical protein